MGSDTKRTDTRRANHLKKAGKDRKRSQQSQGTTPKFPVHVSAAE